jgi:hypothetical protein
MRLRIDLQSNPVAAPVDVLLPVIHGRQGIEYRQPVPQQASQRSDVQVLG